MSLLLEIVTRFNCVILKEVVLNNTDYLYVEVIYHTFLSAYFKKITVLKVSSYSW